MGLLKYRTIKEHFLIDERFTKKDILYLFVFPRTSHTSYFGAMSLYVESILIWKEIPFHRISNQFFLGSKTDGTIPFALYNGKYLDGSEKIIEEIRKKGNKKLGEENDDIRKFAVKTLLKILIADKTFRKEELFQLKIPKNKLNQQLSPKSGPSSPITPSLKKFGSSPKSPSFLSKALLKVHLKTNYLNFPKGPGGLDWMLNDEGIKEQIMQSIPEAFFDPEILIDLPINKEEKNISYNCIINDWEYINNYLKKIINDILNKLLINGELPFCWEKRMREIIGNKNVNEIELFNKFQNEIKSLGLIKKLTDAEKNNGFLNGINPTLADFALFAFLNQFFEGKFSEEKVWKIMKQRPWPLNFELLENEENNNIGDKFEGPFNIQINELTNIHKLLEGNIIPELLIKDENIQLKKELINIGLLRIDEEYLKINNNKGPSEQKEGKNLKENNEKNNYENEIILNIIEIILKKIINKFKNQLELQKIFGQLMLLEMAAFICNLGKNKTEKEGNDCKKKHKEIAKNYLNKYLNNYNEINEEKFNYNNFVKETKELIYKSIIEIIEEKIASKIRISISNVAALINIDPRNILEIRDEN
ncbi:putative esophageal gland cell secretory protein 29 [Meloidogyne graminicola]|uniref:Putative esophageal gland cell secretory protein 29 n=1 Tax=Meloidogyne graminicola TaxID=189291 RepID=A0A8T0A0X0_9BILA|nr:putative esophageal gland cell secretory protein 29 [Meloidogyne graminicola]